MKIFLSPLAIKKFDILISYLEDGWGITAKNTFINTLKAKLKQISSFPRSCGNSSEYPNIFKCVINKNVSLFYRINKDEIEIITCIDNRQDPEKIIEELKTYFP